jgi:hypothetical protein
MVDEILEFSFDNIELTAGRCGLRTLPSVAGKTGLLRASPVWGLPSSGPCWDRSRRYAALGADSHGRF